MSHPHRNQNERGGENRHSICLAAPLLLQVTPLALPPPRGSPRDAPQSPMKGQSLGWLLDPKGTVTVQPSWLEGPCSPSLLLRVPAFQFFPNELPKLLFPAQTTPTGPFPSHPAGAARRACGYGHRSCLEGGQGCSGSRVQSVCWTIPGPHTSGAAFGAGQGDFSLGNCFKGGFTTPGQDLGSQDHPSISPVPSEEIHLGAWALSPARTMRLG